MDKKIIYDDIDSGFDEIIEYRITIKKNIEDIEHIKETIKQNYVECIEKETKNFFGLDSVHFQNKVIELEYLNIIEMEQYINSRIYGDYYKLFILMKEYLEDKLLVSQYRSIKEFSKLKKYPIYKDLDKKTKYEFDVINDMHQDVIYIIKRVNEIHHQNDETIHSTQQAVSQGINLDNYIINQQHINEELLLTNELHEKYVRVYHKFHKKLLKNFMEKISLLYQQMNNYILGDEINTSTSDDVVSETSSFNDECTSLFELGNFSGEQPQSSSSSTS